MPSKTNFETILKEEGELFYTNVGYSMYPLIKSREDILHIISATEFRKGDVALYKTEDGKYILHRILKTKKGQVILAGDHNPFLDKKVPYSNLLGICIEISKKDGKKIDLRKQKKMRRFFYSNFFTLKAFFQRIGNFLHLRKIKD